METVFINRLAKFPTLGLVLATLPGGCVTKSQADMQARLAFMAGQQQALMQQQQRPQPPPVYRGPGVIFMGAVRNPTVPWREGLTLTQAIVRAQYTGTGDPAAILIHRGGENITIEPRQLLNGQDVPLQVGDVIELQPGQDPAP